MAQAPFVPVTPTWTPTVTEEPGASLVDNPCVTSKCLSLHDQLVLMAFLMAAFTDAGTADQIEEATKKFRNLSTQELLAYAITGFSDELIATATPEALKCFKCYSNQKLLEMIAYLAKLMF